MRTFWACVKSTHARAHRETHEVLNSWRKNRNIFIHCVIKCARIKWCGTKIENTQRTKKRELDRLESLKRFFFSSVDCVKRITLTIILFTPDWKWREREREREWNGQNSHLAWCLYRHKRAMYRSNARKNSGWQLNEKFNYNNGTQPHKIEIEPNRFNCTRKLNWNELKWWCVACCSLFLHLFPSLSRFLCARCALSHSRTTARMLKHDHAYNI